MGLCARFIIVGEVCNCFGGGAEQRRTLNVSHGAAEVEADEDVGVAGRGRDDECEFWDVLDSNPDPHVCICEVGFADEDWSKFGVSHDNPPKKPGEGVSKLHGFCRGRRYDRPVEATIGVVVDGAVSSAGLGDARRRRQPEVG